MSHNSATVRERIQAQGFCGLDDATYAQIKYPLRVAPAICMAIAHVRRPKCRAISGRNSPHCDSCGVAPGGLNARHRPRAIRPANPNPILWHQLYCRDTPHPQCT